MIEAGPQDLLFPGLINLHDHPSFDFLERWLPPSSNAIPAQGKAGTDPYANRYQWGAAGSSTASPEERRLIDSERGRIAVGWLAWQLTHSGFWLGMLIVLTLLFAFGYRAPLTGASLFTDPWTTLQMVIGPAIVLGLGQAAYIARMARSSLLEVVREDYVRTARAKGLNNRMVIAFHALPNALLPVITLSGVLLGFVLAGSIPVERAFGTPGLGYAMFTAVSERDVFVMQNLVFLYAVVFVLLNILVDIIIAWLDPRIRLR